MLLNDECYIIYSGNHKLKKILRYKNKDFILGKKNNKTPKSILIKATMKLKQCIFKTF